MKKALSLFAALLIAATLTVPALAYDAIIDGADQNSFGKPTTTDEVNATPADTGTITDKDAQIVPPAFGSPSAYMPGTGEALTPNLTGATAAIGTQTGVGYSVTAPAVSASTTTTTTNNNFDLPSFYEDGSIGTLKIPALNLSVKVYETESLESLSKGVGHFKSTSAWSGNVGLAGHNRGVRSDFSNLHTLKSGDLITYTTKYGTRTYSVYYVGQISETDFSRLGRTEQNILTLITCVNNQPTKRVCVQAREVK